MPVGVLLLTPSLMAAFCSFRARLVLTPYLSVSRPCIDYYAKSLGDVFGHRQIYITGLVGFAIFAALTAAVDSSAIVFFLLRAIQGICAAATIPTAYALVANLYDGKQRELAVAGLGACQAIGATIGTIRKLVIEYPLRLY